LLKIYEAGWENRDPTIVEKEQTGVTPLPMKKEANANPNGGRGGDVANVN